MKGMRRSERLCYRCVQPYALDYIRSRVGPPAYIKGAVAGHRTYCTRCGEAIPGGRGFVKILGEGRAAPPPSSDISSGTGATC